MTNVATAESKEKSKIFQTILSSPGMNEKCKINLSVSRKNVLHLGRLIEAGLLSEKNQFEDEIIASLKSDLKEEFKAIHEEVLRKGEPAEFYYRLKLL